MSLALQAARGLAVVFMVFAGLLSWLAGPSHAQSGDPLAIVRGIFRSYQANRIPSVPWSPAVSNAMRRAELGADPILDAQDTDVRSFSLRQVARGPGHAEIEARFLSFGRNMVSRFDFRLVDGRWTVANYRILAGTEFP